MSEEKVNIYEPIIIRKLTNIVESTPKISFSLEEKGTLLDADSVAFLKYAKWRQVMNFCYTWNILDGLVMLDITEISRFLKESKIFETVYGPSTNNDDFSISLYLMILSFGIQPGVPSGVYKNVTKLIDPSSRLLPAGFDGFSNIRIQSPVRLSNLGLKYLGPSFYDHFRETIHEGEYGTFYEYVPISIDGRPVFMCPNIILRPFAYEIHLDYEPSDVKVTLSYNLFMFDSDLRKRIFDPDQAMCHPIDSRRSISHIPDFIGFTLDIQDGHITGHLLDQLTDPMKQGYSDAKERKNTFLLGLHPRVGEKSLINHYFYGLFGERQLVSIILSYLPVLE